MCYGASVHRRTVLRVELLLQAVTLILYTAVLFFGLTWKRMYVVGSPMSYVRIAGYQPPFDLYNANYYMNFKVITWRLNVSERSLALFTHRPDGRYEGIDFEVNMDEDGQMASITASLSQFKSWIQADIDESYARPHRHFANYVGMSRFDAPWLFDLAVDENGFACDEEIYVYSYSYLNQDTPCTRVYDRDGSLGHHRTYGDFHNTTVHLAVAYTGEGLYAKPKLCSNPTARWSDISNFTCDVCSGRGAFRPDARLPSHEYGQEMSCREMTTSGTRIGASLEPDTLEQRHSSRSTESGVLKVNTAQHCDSLKSRFGPNCCEAGSTAPDGAQPPPPAPPPIHASLVIGQCYHVISFNLFDPKGRAANFLNECEPASKRVENLCVAMLVLSVIRISLGPWVLRWDPKTDNAKKGLNLWLCLLPSIVSIVPLLEYRSKCVDAMNHNEFMQANTGSSLRVLAGVPCAWLVCFFLEFIIPAGDYALKTNPTAPPGHEHDPHFTDSGNVVALRQLGVPSRSSVNLTRARVDVLPLPAPQDESFLTAAATRVQSMFRGHQGRMVVKARRTGRIVRTRNENGAATFIQSIFRGRSSRNLEAARRAGATKVQSVFRGRRGRLEGARRAAQSEQPTQCTDAGTLRVHLQSATSLRPADRNGLSDPYATLSVAGQMHKSKTVPNTLNPEWDEVVEFDGSLPDLVQEGLLLQVFDYDFGSRDDKLGEATVPLAPLQTSRQHTCSIRLADPAQGEVHLQLSWAVSGEAHPEIPLVTDAALKLAGPPGSKVGSVPGGPFPREQDDRGLLQVHLLSASGLPAADSNGTSDPYTKLVLAGQTYKSRVIKKSLSPSWDQKFNFEISRHALETEALQLTVYDRDQGHLKDDKLGFATVTLTELAKDRSRQSFEVKLQSPRRAASNSIQDVTGKALQKMASDMGLRHPFAEADRDSSQVKLVVKWLGQQSEAMKWLQSVTSGITDIGGQALSSVALWLVDPLGEESGVGGDAELGDAAWQRRQYYVIHWDGPRAGDSSAETVALGRLKQMYELGQLPEKVQIWPVDGGGWRRIRQELDGLARELAGEDCRSQSLERRTARHSLIPSK